MKRTVIALLIVFVFWIVLPIQHQSCFSQTRYKINEYNTDAQLGCQPDLPVSFKNYIKQMYQKIESKATLPLEDAQGKIAVSFFVSREGNVSSLNITRSSGNQLSDQAAISAVINAGPFGHFPSDFQSSGTTFNFVFFLKPEENTMVITNNPNNYINQPYSNTPALTNNTVPNFNPVVPTINPVVPTTNNTNPQNNPCPVPLLTPANPGTNTNATTNLQSNPVVPDFRTATIPQIKTFPSQNTPVNKVPEINNSNPLAANNSPLATNFMQNFGSLTKGNELCMTRSPKNPMRYDYQPQFGDYFSTVSSYLNTEGILPKDYHFQKFPIKYWIQPTERKFEKVIREAIDDYSKLFPMEQTLSRDNADLIIEVIQNANPNSTTRGKGGLEFPSLKGTVYLSSSTFSDQSMILSKLTVKHEIAHAMGVIKHSNDPNDIMFPKQRVLLNENFTLGTIQDTGQVKNYEDFGRFTNKDLNTLWVLYNQWW